MPKKKILNYSRTVTKGRQKLQEGNLSLNVTTWGYTLQKWNCMHIHRTSLVLECVQTCGNNEVHIAYSSPRDPFTSCQAHLIQGLFTARYLWPSNCNNLLDFPSRRQYLDNNLQGEWQLQHTPLTSGWPEHNSQCNQWSVLQLFSRNFWVTAALQ